MLPLATAYVVTEAFGLERDIARTFREAPAFMGIYTATLLCGALVALTWNATRSTHDCFPVHRWRSVADYLGIHRAAHGDRALMGEYVSGHALRIIQWITAGILGLMSVLLLLMTVAGFG